MWKVNRGDESPEELAALRRRRRRMLEPTNEAGGVATVHAPVLRSTQCALQLELVRVFSTGVQFQFRVVVRQHRRPGDGPSMLGLGHSGDDALWVGVKLADGRKATNAGGRPPDVALAEDALSLARTGGSGSGRSASLTYYLAPLPPPGPLSVVVAWPAFGIDEATLEITADQLAAAATRMVPLWPADEDDERLAPRRAPQPPPGSWFDEKPTPDRPVD